MKTTHQSRISTVEFIFYLLGMLILLLLARAVGQGQSQSVTMRAIKAPAQIQQQLYREYRGVRLGMTAVEVRTKLGEPVMKNIQERGERLIIVMQDSFARILGQMMGQRRIRAKESEKAHV